MRLRTTGHQATNIPSDRYLAIGGHAERASRFAGMALCGLMQRLTIALSTALMLSAVTQDADMSATATKPRVDTP